MSARPATVLPSALLDGERAPLARAINQVERGADFSAALAPHLGRAHVIGVTGAPGAGKSTLIHALLGELLARGERIGVVAVDPSSPLSGGAVLGDRVRMGEHGAHERVFIRSLASRGYLGGLSRSTARVVDLLDAAGFDTVIVETVGAGQSEVEIMRVADTRIVACPPGLGDGVQAIKAGILEIADVLVVSKGDQPLAGQAERDLKDMLHLRAPQAGWRVRVMRTTATTGEGIPALVDAIVEHAAEAGVGRRLRTSAPAAPADDASSAALRGLAGRDPFQRHNAIEFVEAGPGFAALRMRVAKPHLNFNGKCHGGAIFCLADSAFGIASNSHGVVAAGIDTHMTFQVAVSEGDVLTARATEVTRNAKLAVYRVDVTRDDGTVVSSFTGTVYVTGRPHAAHPHGI